MTPSDKYFVINEPTCISFSGGRTSAYMLWRVLQANNGLPDDAIVCFANTGKEEESTLEFVRDCEKNWDVRIHWLEYRDSEQKFEVVRFDNASRGGNRLRH
jgi:3'-phosphoadenosine 5'-phosphosulfate sulfotransferase (PAPS reductase)/FAD synthetase